MNNLRGALLMILAMGAFALEDMFVKSASTTLPVGQILLFIGTGGTLAFAAATVFQRQSLFPPELLSAPLILRNLFEIVGTFGFVTALALTPIASATAILQTIPLLITLGAALFLGERVGWRRWSAILAGFAGMLLIIRPGASAFDPASLFAVLGACGLAGRDLMTPRIPVRMTALQVSAWGFAMVIPLGAVLLILQGGPVPMDRPTSLGLLTAILLGVCGYYMLILSMRIAELSAIAPFRYSRLIFALFIGLAVFGEQPDTLTLAGATLIVASGLYTLARERALFSRPRGG